MSQKRPHSHSHSFPNNKFIYKTKREINTKLRLGPHQEKKQNRVDSVTAEKLVTEEKNKRINLKYVNLLFVNIEIGRWDGERHELNIIRKVKLAKT